MGTGSPWRTDDPFGARRRKFNTETRKVIVDRYVNGNETCAEIAADFQCTGTTIARVVRDAGHTLRPVSRRPGPLRNKPAPQRIEPS